MTADGNTSANSVLAQLVRRRQVAKSLWRRSSDNARHMLPMNHTKMALKTDFRLQQTNSRYCTCLDIDCGWLIFHASSCRLRWGTKCSTPRPHASHLYDAPTGIVVPTVFRIQIRARVDLPVFLMAKSRGQIIYFSLSMAWVNMA